MSHVDDPYHPEHQVTYPCPLTSRKRQTNLTKEERLVAALLLPFCNYFGANYTLTSMI